MPIEKEPASMALSLMEKWTIPTQLAPTYYWGATRNSISAVPGVVTVIFLAIVLHRRPGVYKQYQYTVVLITFGGYLLMTPVFLFNTVVSAILFQYGGPTAVENVTYVSFQTSVWACTLSKQGGQVIMNCNFCIGFIISLMRYLLLLHRIEMNWTRISIASAIVMLPNLFYLLYIMFLGAVVSNDCCEKIMEAPDLTVPFIFYGYLMLIIIAAILLNMRTLISLQMMKRQHGLVSNAKDKDNLRLTLGFLLQSFAPLFSFGSFLVFYVLYLNGVLGPAWFSTYTNVACFLSTLLDPVAAMAFIPLFRRELVAVLTCKSVEESDRCGRSTTTTVSLKVMSKDSR